MIRSLRQLMLWLTVALIGFGTAGCTKELRKSRHLSRGDKAFKAQNYDQAEIEYLKVLQVAPMYPLAIRRLGLIYQDEGKTVRARAFLMKAAEFEPNDPQIRLQLALNEAALGEFAAAVDNARRVLAKQPGQADALELIATSTFSTNGLQDVQQEIDQLRKADSDRAGYHVALGALALRRQDTTNAETEFKKALQLDPKCTSAFVGLGSIDWARKDLAAAEQAYKSAADSAPPRSIRRLKLAEFQYANGKPDQAKQYLKQITTQVPDFLPAWNTLAQIAFQEKKYDECGTFIQRVLARDSVNLDGLLLNGNLKLAQGDAPAAIANFSRMNEIFTRSPQVLYQLARAHLANNDVPKAISTLNDIVKVHPEFADAVLLLANLNIRKNDPASAIDSLNGLLKRQPYLAQAYLLLVDAHLANKQPDQALSVCRQMTAKFPKSAEVQVLFGSLLLRQNQPAEARKSFEQALALAPGYLPAVERLVDLDVAQNQYPAALNRVQALIDKNPSNAELRLLLSKIHVTKADSIVREENQKTAANSGKQLRLADVPAAQTEAGQAETELLKAVDLNPNLRTSYLMLAELYVALDKQQQALDRLNTLLSKTNDVVALMQVGMIQDSLKNYPAARDAYEKAIAAKPNFTAALNNLAYLYSERLSDQDKAVEMSERARKLAPSDPIIADTLGWILYKKQDYVRALTLLQESAAKLHDQPEIQFHLGMIEYMLGDEPSARAALQSGVQPGKDYTGKDVAARCLFILNLDPKTADAAAQAVLEKQLKESPRDSIALERLGAIQERDGALDKAAASYQSALNINPQDSALALKLAQLYASPALNDPQKALAMAKTAHDHAPDDPRSSALLGQLVLRSGDYKWAASLLEDSARKLPDDLQVNFDLGWAYYSLGRVSDALPFMQKVAGAGSASQKAGEAGRFVAMVNAASSPAQASAFAADAQKTLATDPNYVPALMVAAMAQEAGGNYRPAADLYNQILAKYPQFSPAVRNLGLLYFVRLQDDQKAYDLAMKAREAFPQDAEIGKALGVLTYRKGNYSRAAQLLKESAETRKTDAELLYYLGMAQYQLKAGSESKATLKQALACDLPPKLADDAKRVLAELK